MLKALVIGVAISGSMATPTIAESSSPAGKTEVASTHGHQDIDAQKKAWFEQAVMKILEGRTEPLDANR